MIERNYSTFNLKSIDPSRVRAKTRRERVMHKCARLKGSGLNVKRLIKKIYSLRVKLKYLKYCSSRKNKLWGTSCQTPSLPLFFVHVMCINISSIVNFCFAVYSIVSNDGSSRKGQSLNYSKVTNVIKQAWICWILKNFYR